VLAATVLATAASLAAAIAAAVLMDSAAVRPVTLALFAGPGVPTFVVLARRRMWAPGLFILLLFPALLAILPR